MFYSETGNNLFVYMSW